MTSTFPKSTIKRHKDIWNQLNNDTRYFIITGGRGSGKSFEVGRFSSILSFENNHKILFTRQTMTSAHLSIIPEFQEKIDLLGLNDFFDITRNEIVNKYSNSQIIFRGLKTSSGDQTANLKSLQGIDTWILDEAEELIDETTFDKINLSIRQKGTRNRIILILNPATKEHWIYKRFFEARGVQAGYTGTKEDTTYIHTTYIDNIENLDDSFLDEVERIKVTNPTKFKHVILGGWIDKAEGVVFENWKFGEFNPDGLQVTFGQDYGFSIDPTTLIEIAIDKKKKKIYAKEHLYKPKLNTGQIAEINKRVCGGALIVADSAEPRLIDELYRAGCNIVGAEKGQGSISLGISLLLEYEIIVHPDSVNIAKELNNYIYADKGSKLFVDDYNHLIDPMRYVATYHLGGSFGVEIR
jgi:phage terminase large subunit